MAKNALIVDDSKSACRVLEGLLNSHNLEAHSVHSAEEALEYLRDHKPDVIFLDHNMPGMDGLQAVKIIKRNPATAAIPVLMYTTMEGEVYLGQARALGAVDVLTKERIRDHLEESLAKLGMVEDAAVRDPGRRVAGEELPRRVQGSGNLTEGLQQLQSELSRQMYLILTEEQIAQQEQTKRIAALVQKLVTANNDEIVRRLEVLQELYRAERALEARKRRWLTTGVVGLGLMAVAVLFWQGQRTAATLQKWGNEMRALVATPQVGERAVAAPDRLAPVPSFEAAPPGQDVAETPGVEAPASPPEQALAGLNDRNGLPIGRLLGVDLQAAQFQAVSQSGYLFAVNQRGELGIRLGPRYFPAANCVGEPLVATLPGAVFRDGDNQLWFRGLGEDAIETQPLSMMVEVGECQPIDSEALALRPLFPNDPDVTLVSVDDEPIEVVIAGEIGNTVR